MIVSMQLMFFKVQLSLFNLMLALAGPGDKVKEKVNAIAAEITPITEPLALLALVMVGLSWVAMPVSSEWMQSNKGAIRWVLFGVLLVSLAPTLAEWLTVVSKA